MENRMALELETFWLLNSSDCAVAQHFPHLTAMDLAFAQIAMEALCAK